MQVLSFNALLSPLKDLDFKTVIEQIDAQDVRRFTSNDNQYTVYQFNVNFDDDGHYVHDVDQVNQMGHLYGLYDNHTSQLRFTNQDLTDVGIDPNSYSGDMNWVIEHQAQINWGPVYYMPELNSSIERDAGRNRMTYYNLFAWLAEERHLSYHNLMDYLSAHAIETNDLVDAFAIPYAHDLKTTKRLEGLSLTGYYDGRLAEQILLELGLTDNLNQVPYSKAHLQYLPMVVKNFDLLDSLDVLSVLKQRKTDLIQNTIPNLYRINNDEVNDYIEHSLYNQIFTETIVKLQEHIVELAQHKPLQLNRDLAKQLYQLVPQLKRPQYQDVVKIYTTIPMQLLSAQLMTKGDA